uniref:Excisionase n=1 Tax=Siphoviridae sp. ct4be24 TaxID=2826289 RepID=A0A8S5QRE6_9CAUD|nr:MAG TPA: excisionase [Siphoviridae sp. ct4be24]DAI04211.1 MAG TPA: excisionase [Caudoviricetes sp.]
MQYSNIGESKLRNIMNMPQCNFVLMNGKKKLIKREKFQMWLENQDFI